jgi:3'(2'), 5'-bisphosphate nucleotidase
MSLSASDLLALRDEALVLARVASERIMAIYQRGCPVEHKADNSPLTEADLAAHAVLNDGLKALEPRFPVLSEESSPRVFEDRKRWKRFWLIDPLDGTKEFIARNGEFTVNIALIEEHQPVLGIVYAPALASGAIAHREGGAFAVSDAGLQALQCANIDQRRALRIGVSRSHHSDAMQRALSQLGAYQSVEMGSALKFIGVADGRIDLYPRLGASSSEWDIAAGQCVIECAGGRVCDMHGNALRYNQNDGVLMPGFVAAADASIAWQERIQW